MDIRNFIDLVGANQNAEAKDALEEILSGKNGVFASRQKSYKFTQTINKNSLILFIFIQLFGI